MTILVPSLEVQPVALLTVPGTFLAVPEGMENGRITSLAVRQDLLRAACLSWAQITKQLPQLQPPQRVQYLLQYLLARVHLLLGKLEIKFS